MLLGVVVGAAVVLTHIQTAPDMFRISAVAAVLAVVQAGVHIIMGVALVVG
jgi:hypothetical protein